MNPPFQWNCETKNCGQSGLLTPPTEPILEQDGEMNVPDTDEKGMPIMEVVGAVGKSEIKKPKMKKVPKMVNKLGHIRRQDAVTHVMKTYSIPLHKDLAVRIYMVQLRMGEEAVTRFLCKGCLKKMKKDLDKLWFMLERVPE